MYFVEVISKKSLDHLLCDEGLYESVWTLGKIVSVPSSNIIEYELIN